MIYQCDKNYFELIWFEITNLVEYFLISTNFNFPTTVSKVFEQVLKQVIATQSENKFYYTQINID